jgi:hypothetical protein
MAYLGMAFRFVFTRIEAMIFSSSSASLRRALPVSAARLCPDCDSSTFASIDVPERGSCHARVRVDLFRRSHFLHSYINANAN